MTADAATRAARRRHVVIALALLAWAVALGAGGWFVLTAVRVRAETTRVAARFDPPVWAGQNVTGACSGGFYARGGQTIVIRCLEPI